MASPHATGVAALIISQYGKMPPGKVQPHLIQTADPQACPENPFDPGDDGYNSFYSYGQVNVFNAVTHTTGNK